MTTKHPKIISSNEQLRQHTDDVSAEGRLTMDKVILDQVIEKTQEAFELFRDNSDNIQLTPSMRRSLNGVGARRWGFIQALIYFNALLHGTKDGKLVMEYHHPHLVGGEKLVVDTTHKPTIEYIEAYHNPICPKCHTENPAHHDFCYKCGEKLLIEEEEIKK